MESLRLDDEDLSVEQLPQLLKLSGVKEVYWRLNSRIVGPDGTCIRAKGEGDEVIVKTPLKVKSIPWSFGRLNERALVSLVQDLIPSGEGESYLNPSPWPRGSLKPGEVMAERREEREELQNSLSVDTRYFNPDFVYLNPFFIEVSKEPANSPFVCVELEEAFCFVSSSPIEVSFENGRMKAEGKGILMVRGNNWREVKPYRLSWDLSNPLVRLDFKPKYNVSLYRLEPASIVPFFLDYAQGDLALALVNLSESPVISTVYVTARITEAEVVDENEKVVPEFDRVRIPFRRWGIHIVKLKVRRLMEQYLRKRII
ncbi:MAG: hypothetical protein MPF33_06700 [Candidatus Aramenus sp.]|nr:hypothetical protein [Candidatus Aramenus sp.]